MEPILINQVDIVGIVIEDGFLNRDQGTQWIYYWMRTTFPTLNIPIIKGYPRDAYLAQTRYFVPAWVDEYFADLNRTYPAWKATTPVFTTPSVFMDNLLGTKSSFPLHVLSIGPTTTLPLLLDQYPQLRKKIADVALDLGDITPHPIYPGNGGEEDRKE